MNPELDIKIASIEAVLFIHGEPLPLKKMAEILTFKEEELGPLLDEFAKRLEETGRGLMLLRDPDKVQLVTKPQYHSILAQFVKEELSEDLTPAALETLGIIAYFGPISRNRIEYQRGVNSMFILRNLLLRGLIDRSPDPNHPNSYLYRPSFELLKHLGLSRKEDLPEYEKFQNLLQKFESQP